MALGDATDRPIQTLHLTRLCILLSSFGRFLTKPLLILGAAALKVGSLHCRQGDDTSLIWSFLGEHTVLCGPLPRWGQRLRDTRVF